MSNTTMRILAIIILFSSLGAASAIRKGSTWSSPFVYKDTLRCGTVNERLYQTTENAKTHEKSTYHYLRVSFPEGQEDVQVNDKTYNSSSIGRTVCFKEGVYLSGIEGISLIVLFGASLVLIGGIIANAID